MTIRFDGQVAIVTGAGRGLGRTHALALASRGARVVVNDLGGDVRGEGGNVSAAQSVVDEITAAGGEAFAHGASVTDYAQVEDMVRQTMERWGRIDILVNNAGILRDRSFAKMDMADFQSVIDVHLMGSANCSRAVWDIMREQAYGRIVMTTSSSGLFGNFGQSNYGAAKLGIVGLMHTLCLEGHKYNIHVNCLSPVAATRMTEDLMSEDVLAMLQPELVTPAVVFMASKEAPNRTVISAGAGSFAVAAVVESEGMAFKPEDATPENLAAHFDAIKDPSTWREPKAGVEQSQKFLTNAATVRGMAAPKR